MAKATEGKTTAKETKSQRFQRVAAERTGRAIQKIRLVGSCSSRGGYEYSDAQVKQILAALDKAVKGVASQFDAALKGKEAKGEVAFQFTQDK